MNRKMSQLIYWLPRALALLFALFMSLFAVEVFSENYSVLKTIIALLIHLIPTYIIIIATAIAWKQEGLGSMLFSIIGMVYIFFFSDQSWQTYAIISGPLFFIAGLFLLNKLFYAREENKEKRS